MSLLASFTSWSHIESSQLQQLDSSIVSVEGINWKRPTLFSVVLIGSNPPSSHSYLSRHWSTFLPLSLTFFLSVYQEEWLMDYRGPGFLPLYDLAPSPCPHPPPPIPTGDTQKDWEREIICLRGKGVRGGECAKSYDGERAGPSIIYKYSMWADGWKEDGANSKKGDVSAGFFYCILFLECQCYCYH